METGEGHLGRGRHVDLGPVHEDGTGIARYLNPGVAVLRHMSALVRPRECRMAA